MSSRTCQVCLAYGYDGLDGRPEPYEWEHFAVCEDCRRHVRSDLASITAQHAQLDATLAPSDSEQISGTRETPLGVREDVLDQLAPVTSHTGTGISDASGDQIGAAPAAHVLDAIASEWRDARHERFRERRPVPTVTRLAQWLTNRIDWACEHIPEAVAAAVVELRALVGKLHALNGHTRDQGEILAYTLCPRCDTIGSLIRYTGSDGVRCLTPGCTYRNGRDGYDQWVKLLAAQPDQLREVSSRYERYELPKP